MPLLNLGYPFYGFLNYWVSLKYYKFAKLCLKSTITSSEIIILIDHRLESSSLETLKLEFGIDTNYTNPFLSCLIMLPSL